MESFMYLKDRGFVENASLRRESLESWVIYFTLLKCYYWQPLFIWNDNIDDSLAESFPQNYW